MCSTYGCNVDGGLELAVLRQRATKEVWLDEFGQDSCYVQDWGMLEVNRSVVHTPLTVNGVVYERGLGAHSISRLLYDLDGKAVSISGLAGADDKNLFAGKLQFKILGDKKELWKSGVMQKRRSCKRV